MIIIQLECKFKFVKKFFNTILILFFSLQLFSCYFKITTEEDYKVIDEKYYLFNDMETLKIIIIPLINKSFTDWYYYSDKFDEKYDKYYDNIEPDSNSKKYMEEEGYSYCVYIGKGSAVTKEKVPHHISGTFYQITERETNISTVFFKN